MTHRVRVILVEPSHPGNVGAAARAMKNMCLDTLYLVSPRDFPGDEAVARAAGADDILDRAVICASLDEALAGCHQVFGLTARTRTLSLPAMDARCCAETLVELPEQQTAALVFGRERTGLTNAELSRCHVSVHIPANADYASLNLAAAVQVVAYELMMSRGGVIPQPRGDEPPKAARDEMGHFYDHLEQVLGEIGFLDRANPRQLMRRLRRLFDRAGPDQVELNILRGILSAVQGGRNRR